MVILYSVTVSVVGDVGRSSGNVTAKWDLRQRKEEGDVMKGNNALFLFFSAPFFCSSQIVRRR
jgi:hypothetical protein